MNVAHFLQIYLQFVWERQLFSLLRKIPIGHALWDWTTDEEWILMVKIIDDVSPIRLPLPVPICAKLYCGNFD